MVRANRALGARLINNSIPLWAVKCILAMIIPVYFSIDFWKKKVLDIDSPGSRKTTMNMNSSQCHMHNTFIDQSIKAKFASHMHI